jgi:uncharacterized membrane protein YjgN (DUF898 family)
MNNEPTIPHPARALPIRFTGSGSEYFRIWIVNLLLIIVTATLYWPFARARRLAYFQSNTLVDGQPLGFHGNPRKMFRGYLLMLVLGIAYSVASRVSPVGALVAISALAVVWPALWRASLQFRLANTSWRGVRFNFSGDLKGAYLTMAPAFLPALVMVLLGVWFGMRAEEELMTPEELTLAMGPWMMAVSLAAMLAAPWFLARIKRYQHDHYGYAGQTTQLTASTSQFYALSLRLVGVFLACMLGFMLVGVVLALVLGGAATLQAFFTMGGASESGGGAGASMPLMVGVMAVSMVGMYLALFFVVGAFGVSRMQNLVWGQTSSKQVSFASNLLLWPTVRRMALNAALTVVTLGLYRPFAVVAMTRLRLEAMTVEVESSVDTWAAQGSRMDDAAGDAAGDFFGIDMGL